MEQGNYTMVFGDKKTIFKRFNDEYVEETEFLLKNNGKVRLSGIGFAQEWVDYIDFDKSHAYIDNGKLYVVLHGLPDFLNKKAIKKYFGETLEQYIVEEYGEFFDTEEGCPICMVVEKNGVEVLV